MTFPCSLEVRISFLPFFAITSLVCTIPHYVAPRPGDQEELLDVGVASFCASMLSIVEREAIDIVGELYRLFNSIR